MGEPPPHPSNCTRMRIGVVGLGYVGLPLAAAFAAAGHEVVGVDVDRRRVASVRAGEVGLHDLTPDPAAPRGIEASTDYEVLRGCDAVVLCVPTPLTANREPDLGPLLHAAHALAAVVARGQLVVLESTTFPGTTRERLAPILEGSGLRAGGDFHLAYSPERLDPGRIEHDMRTTPKVVAGLTRSCGDRAEALYRTICDEVVRVSTTDAAELTKLLENIFRSVNIALVNELAVLADRMGIDIWEVVDAASTKPYGFMRFEPGPGMGGHCLPVDPFYLSWRAREFGLPAEFIELAGKVNQRMPEHCVRRIQRALNDVGRPVKGSRVLVLGVAYKEGIDDTRESPAVRIIELLDELGAQLAYHDPHVARLPGSPAQPMGLDDGLSWADVAVIVTAHPDVDHGRVADHARLVVDLRGVTRGAASPTVVRL
jgi:UDP-N-acetyl-D-glucosamine dehydrogenase